MNGLSWLIYWADVVGALNSAFAFVSGAGLVLGVISFVVGWCFKGDGKGNPDDMNTQIGVGVHKWSKGLLAAFVIFMIAASFTPSKNTVYAIAASEVGERALHSQTGDKAVQALNSWLDKQIKGEEPKSEPNTNDE